MTVLDGPRRPPSQGRADALVVLLHGYGADGNDLMPLAQAWAPILPGAAFAAPHAPEPLPQSTMAGRQWFPLTFRDDSELWRGVNQAAPALERFLDAELARHHLAAHRLALVGFSQGTMMALHVGLRRTVPPAAIVGYSGLIAGPEFLDGELKGRPPVLLVHGSDDDLIPVEALHFTREALAEATIAVEWHEMAHLGHGIDAAGLRMGGQFLREHLG